MLIIQLNLTKKQAEKFIEEAYFIMDRDGGIDAVNYVIDSITSQLIKLGVREPKL